MFVIDQKYFLNDEKIQVICKGMAKDQNIVYCQGKV